MPLPPRHERRAIKALFRKGFCQQSCFEKGHREKSFFPIKQRETSYSQKKNYLIEEMAFLGLELQRQEERLPVVHREVLFADTSFGMLSEKLSYLESVTGRDWNSSKFYFWLNKAA